MSTINAGWNVESGPPGEGPVLNPDVLISLTAPKLCSKEFRGRLHWLGGRFVPPDIRNKYNLTLPDYPDADQVVLLED